MSLSKHYLFLRLEQYFPHHTILHRKLYLQSYTRFLRWSLYCILFLSFKKNTHNHFSFLPILATAIHSFKMFKLCSLFSFFMPLSASKNIKSIFLCCFIRNALNRQFPVRKGNQRSNRLPPHNFITCCLFFPYLSHCKILFPLSQSLPLSPRYYSSSAPKASDSPPSTALSLPHVLPSAPPAHQTVILPVPAP